MHLLCRHHTTIEALSASSLSPTSFSAVDAHGSVSLWDVRLKKPNYITINSSSNYGVDHSSNHEQSAFTDIVYYAHCDKVITTNDRNLEVFDIRMTLSSLSTYHHSSDLVAMYYGNNSSYTCPLPDSLQHALVVDENGSIMSIDVSSATVDHVIDECVFGATVNINKVKNRECIDDSSNVSNVASFSKLNNLCSAIGIVESSPQQNNNINSATEHLLFIIDMTGHGVLYDRNLQPYDFTLCNAINNNNYNNNEEGDNIDTNKEETITTNSIACNYKQMETSSTHNLFHGKEDHKKDIDINEVCVNTNACNEENVTATMSVTRSASSQLFNPPLVNYCAFDNENSSCSFHYNNNNNNSTSPQEDNSDGNEAHVNPLIALGRADGTYDVLTIDCEHKCIVELMSAPGHACNGLVYTSWVRSGVLLTTSICGDISVWDVKHFLEDEQDDDDFDDINVDELPTLLDAHSHRDLIAPYSAQVNACIQLGNTSYLIADTLGNVSQCNITL